MLLHRQRVVGAALHRRVVGDDHALDAIHAADAGDDGGRRYVAAIHAVRGELRDFEKGVPGSSRPATRSRGNSLPRARCFWRGLRGRRARSGRPCCAGHRPLSASPRIRLEIGAARVELGFQCCHVSSFPSSAQPLSCFSSLDPFFQLHRRMAGHRHQHRFRRSASCNGPRCSVRMNPRRPRDRRVRDQRPEKLATWIRPTGFSWKPSWPQVSISHSSSKVPEAAGQGGEAIGQFRPCAPSGVHRIDHFQMRQVEVADLLLHQRLGITPVTSPPACRQASATSPMRPILPPP